MKNGGGKSNVDKCETFDHRGWLKKIFGKKPFWLEKDLGYK